MAIVVGLDIGSLATKTVVFDVAEGRILSYNIELSGFDYKAAAEKSINNSLKSAAVERDDVSFILSTGYGRGVATLDALADADVTEITCHARGAHWFFPEVHTVIDIGGQDSKVISLNSRGEVVNFVMNDKCAAGTGRFLEVMASALAIEIGEMGNLIMSSEKELEISSICTVFAESEVISLFAKGNKKEDIASGIAESIARRIIGMVGRVGVREEVVMTGGVAKNTGVASSIEKKIGFNLLVPEEPQIVGALGAAVIASGRI